MPLAARGRSSGNAPRNGGGRPPRGPVGPGIRLDGAVDAGSTVPIDYDPLLAKLAVWAPARDEAADRMMRALREYDVGGIRTNIAFFRGILEDGEFREARLHTGFIEE